MVVAIKSELSFNFETYKRESINTDLSVGSFQKLIGIDAEMMNLFEVKDNKIELTYLIHKQIDDCFKLLKEKNKKIKIGRSSIFLFSKNNKDGRYFSFKTNKEAKAKINEILNDLSKSKNGINTISFGLIYDE